MTPVADKINVDLTDPGQSSPPHWGHHVGARYQRQTEYMRGTHNYRATPRSDRWTLKWTDGGYIASDRLTGIFGFGPGANEAVRDLVAALREHRDVLERQDALSPALQKQLDHLRDLL